MGSCVKCYLLNKTWLIQPWTHINYGYLHKMCTRWSQLEFQHGWGWGRVGEGQKPPPPPPPSWGDINHLVVAGEGRVTFLWGRRGHSWTHSCSEYACMWSWEGDVLRVSSRELEEENEDGYDYNALCTSATFQRTNRNIKRDSYMKETFVINWFSFQNYIITCRKQAK